MSRRPEFRVAAAVFGGVAVAVSLLGILAFMNAGKGFTGCAATTALGWTIPLVAGGLVGFASWLLLVERETDDDHHEFTASTCSACGSPVIDDWRMCPYCGHVVQSSPPPVLPSNESGALRTGDSPLAG